MGREFGVLSTLILLVILFNGCGSNPDGSSTFNNTSNSIDAGPTGFAKLIVSNSGSANSSNSYGSIKLYRAAITGEGIETPIIAEFDGSAEKGDVEGVPAGPDRSVVVEAINQNDQKIREGLEDGIVIAGGEVSEVEVELDAVPIFTNLRDGNVVPSTRIRFEMFADPEDPLEIIDNLNELEGILTDISTGFDEVYPSIDTGLAALQPVSVLSGEHEFVVRSRRTGNSSSVRVKVIDGNRLKAAPLFSSGFVGISGNYVGMTRIGSPFCGQVSSGSLWPRFLEAILAGGN